MSLSTYRTSIRAAFRNGWQGASPLEVADQMYSAVRRGFENAFAEGSKACGILVDERTKEEQDRLNLLIGDNFQYVGQLADWLYQHRQSEGFKFSDVLPRAELWINRYEEVKGIATSMSCQNTKLRWILSGGESCRTCIKLSGRVHRASVWAAHNIAPRMVTNKLRCGGYRCRCSWIQTDEPATKGRFPNLP